MHKSMENQPFVDQNLVETTQPSEEEYSQDHVQQAANRVKSTVTNSQEKLEKETTETIFRVIIGIAGILILVFLIYKKEYNFENLEGKIITYSFFTLFFFLVVFFICVFLISLFIFYSKNFLFNLFKKKNLIYFCDLNLHIGTFVMLVVYMFVFGKSDFYFVKNSFAKLTLTQIFYVLLFCVFFCALAKFTVQSLRDNYDFTNFHDRIKRFYLQSYFLNLLMSENIGKLITRIESIKYERLLMSLYSDELGFRGEEVKELPELLSYLSKTPNYEFSPHERPSDFLDMVILKSNDVQTAILDRVNDCFSSFGRINEVLEQKNLLKTERRCIKIKEGETKCGYLSLFDFLQFLSSKNNKVFYDLLVYLKTKDDSDKYIFKMTEENIKENYYLKNNIKKMKEATNKFLILLYFFVSAVTLALLFLKASGDIKVATGFFSTTFSLSMIFQTTLINTINNLIFIFNMHPYDIGDRVIINFDNEDHNLVVTELNINTTHFIRFDGTLIQIANHILLRKMIINISRSVQQLDKIELQVSHFTSQETLAILKYEIKNYIKKNSEIFINKLHMFYEKVTDCNKLSVLIFVQFKKNWHNWERYLEKRSKLLRCINNLCIKNKIEYKLITQPVHIVNES